MKVSIWTMIENTALRDYHPEDYVLAALEGDMVTFSCYMHEDVARASMARLSGPLVRARLYHDRKQVLDTPVVPDSQPVAGEEGPQVGKTYALALLDVHAEEKGFKVRFEGADFYNEGESSEYLSMDDEHGRTVMRFMWSGHAWDGGIYRRIE